MVLVVTGHNTNMPGSKSPHVQFCRIELKELCRTNVDNRSRRKTVLDVQIMFAARPCSKQWHAWVSVTWCTKSKRVELRKTGRRGSPIRTFRAVTLSSVKREIRK